MRTTASTVDLEVVRGQESRGWLTPAEAVEFLAARFGHAPSLRTVQHWTRRRHRPLPAVRLGARVLVNRADLLQWLAPRAEAEGQDEA
jgi:Helix-turn-helix domain